MAVYPFGTRTDTGFVWVYRQHNPVEPALGGMVGYYHNPGNDDENNNHSILVQRGGLIVSAEESSTDRARRRRRSYAFYAFCFPAGIRARAGFAWVYAQHNG